MFPNDEDYMRHALGLGRRHQGLTWPNPSVGCVIVKGEGDGAQIIARAVTARGGRPHAEALALEKAGKAAKGTQVYVTLEPCSHYGKTPPCAEALIKAGVARVIYPFDDPDPRVQGASRKMLERAGIEVVTGIGADQARRDLAGFIARVKTAKPHIVLKLAHSSDGKIAAQPGQKTTITGPLAQARSHLMRAKADAIAVGIGTVLTDDPQLTCRLEGLEDRSPLRIIFDSTGRLPLNSRLAQSVKNIPVWLVVGEGADRAQLETLESKGVEIISCPVKDDKLDLSAAFETLAARGLNQILVEGGADIAQNLVKQGLVDECILFQAPMELGSQGVNALGALPLEKITGAPEFNLIEQMTLEQDRLTRYIRR